MSINPSPIRVLINNTASLLTVTNGQLVFSNLQGINPIPISSVERGARLCSSSCVAQVMTITPAVPTAPCECPWSWDMVIQMNQCDDMRTDHIYGRMSTFSYQTPSGDIPTVNQIVDNIVDEINGDPYGNVTAAKVGSPGTYTAFTLTEKNCTSEVGTCGFRAEVKLGTKTVNTINVGPQLDWYTLKKIFAERPGYFWGEQQSPIKGDTYCLYTMRVDHGDTLGPHLSNERANRFQDYEFYVRRDSTFLAQWDTPLTNELPIFGAPLV